MQNIKLMKRLEFRQELGKLINRCSMENGSDTPDWILRDYLIGCLVSFDESVKAREKWYGREPKPVDAPIGVDGKTAI